MLVDDDQDTVEIFTEELRKHGFDVDGFTNPLVALDNFKANMGKFSMILSDIRMPQMNGFEFVREIRTIDPEVHVLFITAFEINMAEFLQVLPSTKIDGFIKKPITPGRLAEVIKEHLDAVSRPSDSITLRGRHSHAVTLTL